MPPANYSSKLLLDEYPLIVLPTLACTLGLGDAIFIQQIHYWLHIHKRQDNPRHYHAGRWWCYNSIAQWHEQLPFLSPRTLARIIRRNQQRGVLITANYNLYHRDQTLWYTLDYQTIDDLVERYERKRAQKWAQRPCQVGMMEQAKLACCTMPSWHDGACQDGMMLPETTTETSTETSQIWRLVLGELGLIVGHSALPQLERMHLSTLDPDEGAATITCRQAPDPNLATLIARTLADVTGQALTIEYQARPEHDEHRYPKGHRETTQ